MEGGGVGRLGLTLVWTGLGTVVEKDPFPASGSIIFNPVGMDSMLAAVANLAGTNIS